MKRFGLCICGLLALLLARPVAAQEKYTQQWNMVGANLTSDEGMNKFIDLVRQSKECGCTHILFDDSAWLRIPDNRDYQARVNKVKAAAKDLGIDLVPAVYAFAVATRYLKLDPNLSAGLPVKDMPFVVKGKVAVPDPAMAFDLSKFTGAGRFKVPKFMYYKVTLRTSVKPPPAEEAEAFRASGMDEVRWLTRMHAVTVQQGDEWVTTNTFNSLENETVQFRVTVPDAKTIKEVKVELAGAMSILRRDMLPLVVTSDDGQTVYEEGRDFKKLVDPRIAAGSCEYGSDHEPNNIELTEDSRIKDGQKLKVSFFHAYKVYNKVNITMEDPRVYKLMEDDIANCTKVWNPDSYFMHFDEIRIGGWETPSIKPSKVLADMTERACNYIRKVSPKATIYTWSDMFCPQQNAWPADAERKNFFMVHGTWAGSWEGLPKDVIVMNWVDSAAGIKFFADRGQSQVLCGYYDQRDTAGMKKNITGWKQTSKDVGNILGFMYTQWGSGYGSMKEYFNLLNTYEQWSNGAN